jgi:Rrf2 family protein
MRSKYAIRACLALAQEDPGQAIMIADLAQRAQLPHKYLEAILLRLRNEGFLVSRKGRGGGYRLSKHPHEISIGKLVQATDQPMVTTPCNYLSESPLCNGCKTEIGSVCDGGCSIQHMLAELFEAATLMLDKITLQDLIDREAKLLERHRTSPPDEAPAYIDILRDNPSFAFAGGFL